MTNEQQKAIEELRRFIEPLANNPLEQAQRAQDEAKKEISIQADHLTKQVAIVLKERDELRAAWLAEHKETCLHHTDAERKAAGCPVCVKRNADSKRGDRLEGAALAALETIESVMQQRDELQAKLSLHMEKAAKAVHNLEQRLWYYEKHFSDKSIAERVSNPSRSDKAQDSKRANRPSFEEVEGAAREIYESVYTLKYDDLESQYLKDFWKAVARVWITKKEELRSKTNKI